MTLTPQTQESSTPLSGDRMLVSARDWEDIIDRYTDPERHGSRAARLNMVLHDPARAQDLTYRWIMDNVLRLLKNGRTITPVLLRMICERTSIETILHDAYGTPVNVVRAGCGFEKRRIEYETLHGHKAPRSEWARLWDEAVTDRMIDMIHRRSRGEIRQIRWLPLSDGRSSNPDGRGTPNPKNGLDAWLRLLDGQRDSSLDTGIQVADPRAVEGGTFRPDADWLKAHGVDARKVLQLDPEELESMGVDSSALLDAAETLRREQEKAKDDREKDKEKPADRPKKKKKKETRAAREKMLTRILDDATAARRLSRVADTTVDILVRCGMPRGMARAGIMFEALYRNNSLSRACAWTLAVRRVEAHVAEGEKGVTEYVRMTVRIAREYADPATPLPGGEKAETVEEADGEDQASGLPKRVRRAPDTLSERTRRLRSDRMMLVLHDRRAADWTAGLVMDDGSWSVRRLLVAFGMPERLVRTGIEYEHRHAGSMRDESRDWRTATTMLDRRTRDRAYHEEDGLDRWQKGIERLKKLSRGERP